MRKTVVFEDDEFTCPKLSRENLKQQQQQSNKRKSHTVHVLSKDHIQLILSLAASQGT